MALKDYGFQEGEGIMTSMHALRPDYKVDDTHCITVDQWDWELAITKEQRNLDYLKDIVRKIYRTLKQAEGFIRKEYQAVFEQSCKEDLWNTLPEEITFVHSEDLIKEYPNMTAKQRETQVVKKYGAVFLVRDNY
jgi:aspartate--ammonia ligase